jgi:predicted phage tail protein
MIRKVKLYGALKKYSKEIIELDAPSVRILMTGLCSRFGEAFKREIRAGQFHVVKGRMHKRDCATADTVDMNLGNVETLHIVPVIEGSKGANIFQRILGVVLIIVGVVVAWWFGWTGVGASFGYQLIIAGAGMLLMSFMTPKPKSNERSDERASFIFNGPVNTMEQGGAIPLVYGVCRTGSAVISVGVSTSRI